ncbi:MAG: aspartate carbamoyltransferase regulatory subunit [Clostridia bacterium]|nr:aspartate carbamoyltransferase regulatory subunit [Clostridia bacterium]
MKVDSIQNGIVIDHIEAGNGMVIYNHLGLDKLGCQVALIRNALSRKMGKKDIIKIDSDIKINPEALGFIDSGVTVNIIRDGVIVEKLQPELPEKLVGVLFCKNPRCITTTEQELPHIFKLTDRQNHVYRCQWCEAQADK